MIGHDKSKCGFISHHEFNSKQVKGEMIFFIPYSPSREITRGGRKDGQTWPSSPFVTPHFYTHKTTLIANKMQS